MRSFSEDPIITGPLVCHLCEDATFAYDADFAAHKQKVHSGENDYRKRVLFLMEQSGSRPTTGQEKIKILRTFALRKSLGAKLHVYCARGRTSLNIGTS